MIINSVIKGGSNSGSVKFSYSGLCAINGNILRLLDSGTFVLLENDAVVDIFLCGAGGGGGKGVGQSTSSNKRASGGGGGGGYTWSQLSVSISAGLQCTVQIGAGGATLTAGGATTFVVNDNFSLSAEGGLSGSSGSTSSYYGGAGGNGGSGGGAGAYWSGTSGTNAMSTPQEGATDGASGLPTTEAAYQKNGGIGQGTTTRAFGEADGELFATGGSGGSFDNARASDALPNTGNGGDGGNTNNAGVSANIVGGSGGSGIVMLRFPEGAELAQVA